MKRVLLIGLSLVLALVGWSAVCADDGFYVIPAMRGNYAPVPKTGQTVSLVPGDDGNLKKGVASPTPRFTDNNNGTVTDNLTKLIWTKNANFPGVQTWAQAMDLANTLQDIGPFWPNRVVRDGSKAGDWRLPNIRELQSLVDYAFYSPTLPNTLGTGRWAEGNPFQGVQLSYYWSSSTPAYNNIYAWIVNFATGSVNGTINKSDSNYVWCVRAGP